MAKPPTKDDIQKLLDAGYNLIDIGQFIQEPGALERTLSQVNNSPSRSGGGGTFGKPGPLNNDTTRSSLFSPLPQSGIPMRAKAHVKTASNNGSGLASLITKLKGQAEGIGSQVAGGISSGVGRLATAIAEQTAKNRKADTIGTGGIISKTRNPMGDRGVGVGVKPPAELTYETEEFQQPNFTVNDFTPQANQQVGSAYAPRYAAIDQAAANMQQQYGRADKMTAGLYENLAKSIAQSASDTAARYATAQTQQGEQTQGLQQNIGQGYEQAQNHEAALAAQLGQQIAAPEVMRNETNDSGWQQGQAAIQGDAQRNALTTQGNGQVDYMNNIRNAEVTQGTVSREGLINQLGLGLSGLDQQRMNLSGDQASTALQIAQQLSDRDLQLQQMNYGGYTDAYGARQADRQGEFAAGQANQQAQAQAQAELQDRIWRERQAAQSQANADRDYEFGIGKYQTDLINSAARQKLDQDTLNHQVEVDSARYGQEPATDPISQVTGSLGLPPAEAKAYFDFADQFAKSGNEIANSNIVAFVDAAGKLAQNKGLNPSTAQRAAAAYFQKFLGK